MTKTELYDLVEKIWETFYEGGGFAHNLISIDLRKIAAHDKELADEVYQELQEEGF